MTREEILAMEPGRELDALVAEKVFSLVGYEKVKTRLYQRKNADGTIDGFYLSNYSTDISAAWEVVEELNGKFSFNIKRLGDYFYQDPDYGWQALFTSIEARMVIAKTAPEAICKAALLAVMDT